MKTQSKIFSNGAHIASVIRVSHSAVIDTYKAFDLVRKDFPASAWLHATIHRGSNKICVCGAEGTADPGDR